MFMMFYLQESISMEIKIFYGPKQRFEELLTYHDITTLSEFIRKHDSKNRNITINQEEDTNDYYESYDCLVAYSESYSAITESAIQSFNSLLSEYDIDMLYLQNPPTQISTQLEESFPEQVESTNFEYNKLKKESFLKIYNEFSDNIIGQNNVKKQLLISLYSFIKNNDNKPIVLMFYGASGVGKTQTAKFLSDILNQELFRKQFSMFQNIKFSEYLFGGNHAQPSFARDLLDRTSNVILLDEFDKAASLFHEAFYQLFDEGVFEDKNYKVKLQDTIIICTSNYMDKNKIRESIGDPLFFRFDKFINFNKLSSDSIEKIIKINIKKKYDNLDTDEKDKIDIDKIEKLLLSYVSQFENAREVSNIINEAINTELVENFIKDNS